jgi:hypothetical protein
VFGQSSLFNDDACKIVGVLISNATGEDRAGNKQSGERERGREREEQINRVRDGALDGNRNGLGWKWLLVKKDT